MTDDQRFASRRPDVLTFSTDILQEDITLGGPLVADLVTIISTTDADFVVKLIDVFPDEYKYDDSLFPSPPGRTGGAAYPMGGYQMLVRGEIMRGKYRNSFSAPEPFTPGKITQVKFSLPDVAHTFKKGHKLMIQVQSTWFPIIDRNPQKYIPNIFEAKESDFIKATETIYCNQQYASYIELPVMKE